MAALTALVLVAFGFTVTASFHFDDYALLADPFVTSSDGWLGVWRAEQTRPLTYFTFWLNYAVGGESPAGYHALSLLVHLIAVLLLHGTLSRLMPAQAAFVATAIFAVHPIQAEPAAYIYARATLLMGLFCILSLRSWLDGKTWIATAWFAAALLAKEECAAFPVVLLLLQFAASRDKREIGPIAAMTALALAAGLRVIHVLSQTAAAAAGSGASVSALDYFSTQGVVILRYFRLLLVPYGFTVDPDIAIASPAAALVSWGVLAGIALLAARRFIGPGLGFWVLAGLVLLLPSSSIFPANDLAADRRVYLPLVFFAVFAALVINRGRVWIRAAVIVALAVLTIGRVQTWRTERSLWSEAVERAPSKVRPRVQLSRASPPGEAIQLLEETKGMAPEDPLVAAEIGRRRLEMGQAAQALAEFGRALALAPRDPRAHNNRGAALLSLGQLDAARGDFERALELDPCQFDARLNLLRMGGRADVPPGCRFTPGQLRALAGPR